MNIWELYDTFIKLQTDHVRLQREYTRSLIEIMNLKNRLSILPDKPICEHVLSSYDEKLPFLKQCLLCNELVIDEEMFKNSTQL